MSLLDLLTGSTGTQVAQEAENKFGISQNQIIALGAVAAPLIIGYLRNKAQNPAEAEALNATLDKHHDGSVLNDPAQLQNRQEEGSTILDHIFGQQKTQVENSLSEQTGISAAKVGPLLAMLAPLVMGYIGHQKQANGVTSGGGIGDLLGGILGNAQNQAASGGSPLNDILGSVLGGQNSNNPLGDILGSVMGGGSAKPANNSIGDLMGSLFGK